MSGYYRLRADSPTKNVAQSSSLVLEHPTSIILVIRIESNVFSRTMTFVSFGLSFPNGLPKGERRLAH